MAGFLVGANSAFSRLALSNGNIASLRLLFNENLFLRQIFSLRKMMGFPYFLPLARQEAKMQRGTRNCIFLILLRFFSKSSHFRCLFCLPTLTIFLLVVPCQVVDIPHLVQLFVRRKLGGNVCPIKVGYVSLRSTVQRSLYVGMCVPELFIGHPLRGF